MTKEERKKIDELLRCGWGYRRISTELSLPINTVKQYCRRHTADDIKCEYCGGSMVVIPGTKKKRFCCDACRMSWWKEHQSSIQRSNYYDHVCDKCGIPFKSIRKESRYCSRRCYADARRKVANCDG